MLDYIDKQKANNAFTEEIDKEVIKIRKNEMWRREYMKTVLHDMEMKEEGRAEGIEEGRAEGREEGRTEGENSLARLMQALLEQGRVEDAKRAAADKEYRETLYKEFGSNC